MSGHAARMGIGAVALLREDPEMGAGIPADEWRDAERLVVVPGFGLDVGPWELPESPDEPNVGVLVLDGLITVNVALGDRVSAQLAGPGDVIHGMGTADALVPAELAFFVSEPARVAVLDRRFIVAVRRWPTLMLTLHERLRQQERRGAIHAAIGKLRRVEDRVLALLWHLAERWGRVTAEGVIVPLALTHETIGRLAGAERPTVSLALTELAARGEVQRRGDGAFVLSEPSIDRLGPAQSGRPQARPLTVTRAAGPAPERPAGSPLTVPASAGSGRAQLDIAALRARIAALNEELPERARHHHRVLRLSRESSERNAATRERLRGRRETRPTG